MGLSPTVGLLPLRFVNPVADASVAPIVIAGLDPAIHAAPWHELVPRMFLREPWVTMDARVKPAHDDEKAVRREP
jgi:hypothetical protein